MTTDVPTREPAGVMVFWDYDTQWGAERSRGPGGAKDWGPLEFPNTDRLLELHAEFDIPACFAVVGAAALPGSRPYHDPAQIRSVHEYGHEIASHSFRHDWLPGLGRSELRATLVDSKDALEQCIGAPVRSFVPPYNQPFDYPQGWSISLSERRTAGRERTDLGALCDTLMECGYRFCRTAYRPLSQRLIEGLYRKRIDRPSHVETIRGIQCVRVNTNGGFAASARQQIELVKKSDGIVVVYGHPHSLTSGNSQDEAHLVPFLRYLSQLRNAGIIRILLPRDLLCIAAEAVPKIPRTAS